MSNRGQVISYGQNDIARVVEQRLRRWEDENVIERIWDGDPTVWSDNPQHKREISRRLGWLTSAEVLRDDMEELIGFADEVRHQYTHIVLLGMGGSSLAPEVFSLVNGVAKGFPQFRVLDSTDPKAVRDVESWCDLARTLFIVASKSGGTVETRVLGDYFYERLQAIRGQKPGENFVAITDPDTSLEADAKALEYRRTFLNIPTIGGRYSALSLFGLVPASLMGIDVKRVLESGHAMMAACGPDVPLSNNPGAVLGVALGELGLAGQDKVTFLLPARWASFGNWAEQLIAESTGKDGKGLVPVALEPPGIPRVYGPDRVIVTYEIPGGANGELGRAVDTLERAGHPVIRIRLEEPDNVGREYIRWCFATAVAGAVLGINPFDQPDVQVSKMNTVAALKAYEENGALPTIPPALEEDGVRLYGDVASSDLVLALRGFFAQVQPGNYLALQAYLAPDGATWQLLQDIRVAIRDALGVATSAAYGPRFLHSTGQLHKGGPPIGVFMQITSDHAVDVRVNVRAFSFGTLIDAQAHGDWQVLTKRGLRAIRVHLSGDVGAGLSKVRAAVQAALGSSDGHPD